MVDVQYKLNEMSNSELRRWVSEQDQGTAEYTAGIEESMRRVAAMEEVMEKNEAPIWRRECVAIGIALLAVVMAILAIVVMYK